jgi:hypothetical protein
MNVEQNMVAEVVVGAGAPDAWVDAHVTAPDGGVFRIPICLVPGGDAPLSRRVGRARSERRLG